MQYRSVLERYCIPLEELNNPSYATSDEDANNPIQFTISYDTQTIPSWNEGDTNAGSSGGCGPGSGGNGQYMASAAQSTAWSQGGKNAALQDNVLTSKMRQLNNLLQDGQNVTPPQWGRNGIHDSANADQRERGTAPKGGGGYAAGGRGKGSHSDDHDQTASH